MYIVKKRLVENGEYVGESIATVDIQVLASLEVRQIYMERVVLFLGPSGSGKTQLISKIMGSTWTSVLPTIKPVSFRFRIPEGIVQLVDTPGDFLSLFRGQQAASYAQIVVFCASHRTELEDVYKMVRRILEFRIPDQDLVLCLNNCRYGSNITTEFGDRLKIMDIRDNEGVTELREFIAKKYHVEVPEVAVTPRKKRDGCGTWITCIICFVIVGSVIAWAKLEKVGVFAK